MAAPKEGEERGQVKLASCRIHHFREEIKGTGPVRIAKEPLRRRKKKWGVRNGRMSVRTSPQLH